MPAIVAHSLTKCCPTCDQAHTKPHVVHETTSGPRNERFDGLRSATGDTQRLRVVARYLPFETAGVISLGQDFDASGRLTDNRAPQALLIQTYFFCFLHFPWVSGSSDAAIVRPLDPLPSEMYVRTHAQFSRHLPRVRTRVCLRNLHRRNRERFTIGPNAASPHSLPRPSLDRELQRARATAKIASRVENRYTRQPKRAACRTSRTRFAAFALLRLVAPILPTRYFLQWRKITTDKSAERYRLMGPH